MTAFIIDCDAGRDDALAIWLALNGGLNLVGVVSSYGNTSQRNVNENCLRILSFAGRPDIPVFSGLEAPQDHHKGMDDVVLPRQAVSGNGLCNLTLPPAPSASHDITPHTWAEHLRELAAQHGKLHYIITGPASNFAAVLAVLGDAAHDLIAHVTMWAGKLDGLWATNPGAEFNTICDPFAVQAILDSGLPTTFVPMDTTWHIKLDLADIETLRAQDAIGQFAKDLMIAHCLHFAPEPIFRFHDPCAILAVAKDAPLKADTWRVNTNVQDAEFGRTCSVKDGAPVTLYMPEISERESVLDSILNGLRLKRA